MKTAIILALMGALAVSPAMARGMGEQRSDVEHSQSGQSARLDQNTARQVQQQLQSQGYDVGQVDGVWGAKSRQALMNFQRDQNIQANGRPDRQTMAALGIEPSATQQAQTPEGSRRTPEPQRQERQEREGGGLLGR
ncbi:MAG: peptidoglycan-binding domain-containing protein [Bacteroidota bacterium]